MKHHPKIKPAFLVTLAVVSGCTMSHGELVTGRVDIGCGEPRVVERAPSTANHYEVNLELVGAKGKPTGNGIVTILQADGRNPATVACSTSQIRMRLPPGRYVAIVDMADGPAKTVRFHVVASQEPLRLIVRFPTITARALEPTSFGTTPLVTLNIQLSTRTP